MTSPTKKVIFSKENSVLYQAIKINQNYFKLAKSEILFKNI